MQLRALRNLLPTMARKHNKRRGDGRPDPERDCLPNSGVMPSHVTRPWTATRMTGLHHAHRQRDLSASGRRFSEYVSNGDSRKGDANRHDHDRSR